jgi:hypothetical protein
MRTKPDRANPAPLPHHRAPAAHRNPSRQPFRPVIVGNNLVYRDDNHVTIEYAQVLGPVLGAIAERALAKR